MYNEVITAIGTPNIALIKYWGKRDESLILPTNSSISMTLDEQLNTKTSVMFSKRFRKDRFYINGELQDTNNKEIAERINTVDILRKMAGATAGALVVSKNSFPTASGLASSASGIATLTFATSKALGLNLSASELSVVARRGSGSACRSTMGGIVMWKRGKRRDGLDSYAEQIVDEKYWPDLVDIVAIVSEARKKVSSRAGMRQTVQSSVLFKSRMGYVERASELLISAVRRRDFTSLAEITMRDSDNMHATMLDTWPPIMYLNDHSKEIIYAVHELNELEGNTVAAYTFDAGPNANIITTKRNAGKVMKMLSGMDFVKKTIRLGAGAGPRILDNKESLITEKMVGNG